MNKPLFLLFSALAALAIFSCSGDNNLPCATCGDDPLPPPLWLSSSSSLRPGDPVQEYGYCVYPEIQQCYYVPHSSCPSGGILSNVCPYSNSSTVAASSSSFTQNGQISSATAPEYGYCVFASDKTCLVESVSVCPPGGTLSDSCPYGSSSSSRIGSSSSYSNSSSSSSLPTGTVLCLYSGGCVAFATEFCSLIDGQIVQSCPSSSSSSAPLPSSSSSSIAPPSSSSAPPSSSSVATYTITYNANNGSGAPAAQTKTHDVSLTLSASKPARMGYVFTDWNTAADGSGTSYASGASYAVNASLTLYAQWTANTYTVTYNANGGSGAPSNQTKTHDVSLTLSSTTPTRTGYAFNGWNTASGGGGTSYAAGASYTGNANVTLYAQWRQISTINGSSVDYQGETYQTVVIGTQTWFKRNLNYAAPGSVCYNNLESNCDTYGRLYNWSMAMNISSTCNNTFCVGYVTKHRGICPEGWHIPDIYEWETMMKVVDPSCAVGSICNAGTKLKSVSGWNSYNGTDDYGFSALPGGTRYPAGSFIEASGSSGAVWWSSTEYDFQQVNATFVYYDGDGNEYSNGDKALLGGIPLKNYWLSVRCLQD